MSDNTPAPRRRGEKGPLGSRNPAAVTQTRPETHGVKRDEQEEKPPRPDSDRAGRG